jgi:hypothetical protein
MRRLLPLLASVVLVGGGCAELRGTFTAMLELQSGIVRTFGEPNVTVNIADGGNMTIGFVNSSSAALPEADRAVRATEVARYVTRHWPKDQPLNSLAISFSSRSGVSGLTFTSSTTPYTFSQPQLGQMVDDTLAPANSAAIPDSTGAAHAEPRGVTAPARTAADPSPASHH